MPIHKEFDKGFFKRWSPELSYILGFLFADGNIIRTKRNTHFVSLYTVDKNIILSIRNLIKSNHKISSKKSKTGVVYSIQIGSFELFNDLCLLGLTPNKAKRMKLPKLPKEYQKDFIRGYFDGDGCVWVGFTNAKRKKHTNVMLSSFTSASHEFLYALSDTLKRFGLTGGSLFRAKNGNYSRLQYSTINTLKLYKIMYNESDKLFLLRKKLIFEKFIELRKKMRP